MLTVPRFSRLIVVCAWCSQFQSTRQSQANITGTSHTICPACQDRVLVELDTEKGH